MSFLESSGFRVTSVNGDDPASVPAANDNLRHRFRPTIMTTAELLAQLVVEGDERETERSQHDGLRRDVPR